ncbi:MAG: GerMN domain-containing protein [Candidatus Margulisbacteria bacterium]|nr:GerMN domain-containing protein [Candidatus Margulisiibacteriota bacterium]
MKRKSKKNLKRLAFFAGFSVVILVVLASFYLGRRSAEQEQPSITLTDGKVAVKLYYYNKLKDKLRTFDPKFVLPVERRIPRGKAPIQDTIKLLLQGKLRWQEKSAGFDTEFPNPEFKLLTVKLKDGVLTLKFTDVPGFTSGGASRVGLLAAQIKKTALQFPQVKEVRIIPEYLFQP